MKVGEITIQFNNFDENMALRISKTALNFESEIMIQIQNKKVNAKSLMGVISLALQIGDTILVTTHGKDEMQAMNAMQEVLKYGR